MAHQSSWLDPDVLARLGSLDDLGGLIHGISRWPDARIEMCNCHFHVLSQESRDVVCGLNLRPIEGDLDAVDQSEASVELNSRPNHCCVTIYSCPPRAESPRSPLS